MSTEAAITRAKEIVRNVEWFGDWRANMTRVIGAGRVLAKRVDELEAELEALRTERTTRS